MIVRKDADGNPTSFQARYVNPLDPSKKVGRNFGLEYETEAYRWLDEEHYLVTLHNKGIRQWVHPSQRGTDTMPTFREYAKDYFDKYRKPDGSKLSGRSNRCNEIVLRRLNKTFGDIPLDRITRQMVDEWYTTARDELTAWTFEQAARTLKRIMLAAATEQNDGTPPLIPASPCRYRVIKPQSKRRDQPPITADEIKRLADLFPDYYRLTPCCSTRPCWTNGCSRPRPSSGRSAWPAKRSAAPTSPSTHCAPRTPPCSSSREGPCARRWMTSATPASPSRWTATSESSGNTTATPWNSSPTSTCQRTTRQ